MSLNKEFYIKLNKISSELGMNPRDLLIVMYSESGLNPLAFNSDGNGGGLVGFMPDTLRGLGVPKDKIPTFFKDTSAEDQLDYVKKLVRGYMSFLGRPFKSASEYYHANFFPKTLKRWKGTDPIENANVVICAKDSTDKWERIAYKHNTLLDMNKDGQITVGDMTAWLIQNANRKGFQHALSQLNSVAGNGNITEVEHNPDLMKLKPQKAQMMVSSKPKSTSGIEIFLNKLNDFLSSFSPMPSYASIDDNLLIKEADGKFTHSHARDALTQAYKKLYKREPSEGELDFGLATAFFETGYGRAGGQFARWAAEGKYNWGALETSNPDPDNDKKMNKYRSAGLHPTKEKGSDAGRPVYFYLFPNDVEAAEAFLMTWGQPDTLKAAATGSSFEVAKTMKGHGYYEGFWVPPGNPRKYKMPPFKEAGSVEEAERNNIRDYASALAGGRSVITGKRKSEPQQIVSKPKTYNLEGFLDRINQFISSLSGSISSHANDNNFLIIVEAEDLITKAEYARILQSVLKEELNVLAAIHSNDDSLELSCELPFDNEKNELVLNEICSAVSDVFKIATAKIGGCKTNTIVISSEYSNYPEIDIKISEINRRKFQLKVAANDKGK